MEGKDITRNGASDNSLVKIDEWVKKRLKGEAYEPPSMLLKGFVQDKIDLMVNSLRLPKDENNILFVTVRKSFRNSQKYLRPVYTVPEEFRDYVVHPDRQAPFAFDLEIEEVFADLEISIPKQDNEGNLEDFGSLHAVDVSHKFPKDGESKNPDTIPFAPRIDGFWSRLTDEEDPKGS